MTQDIHKWGQQRGERNAGRCRCEVHETVCRPEGKLRQQQFQKCIGCIARCLCYSYCPSGLPHAHQRTPPACLPPSVPQIPPIPLSAVKTASLPGTTPALCSPAVCQRVCAQERLWGP